jgi:hypothetical protein
MAAQLCGIAMLDRDEQRKNANRRTVVQPSAIVTAVRDVQSPNASSPMVVQLGGIAMDGRDVQSRNADRQMVLQPSAMVIAVRDEQRSDACGPMVARPRGVLWPLAQGHDQVLTITNLPGRNSTWE